ncbi:DNA adenine methylase [Candidatus Pacearchaeota archaeon]|nr:DNA adenine methylase [Candidatus Pacearchaeota archaeon]
MNFYSPLRYPGGKGKLTDFFHAIIEENNLSDGYYVEPYAGGASVALSLLFNEYVSKIIINDLDRSIYAFWFSVLNETRKLCELILKTKVNLSNWRKSKKIQHKKQKTSLLELGFSTFFLNRTNRSGIIKGGVIGGKHQEGKWKIDARFNKKDLISRIERIADYKNRIEVYNLDACALCRKLTNLLPKRTLFYFDPPYYLKGRNLYVNYYNYQDHITVARMVRGLRKFRWVVTYDNRDEIKRLYSSHRKIEYSLLYTASKVSEGLEVMFFDDNLNIPTIKKLVNMK